MAGRAGLRKVIVLDVEPRLRAAGEISLQADNRRLAGEGPAIFRAARMATGDRGLQKRRSSAGCSKSRRVLQSVRWVDLSRAIGVWRAEREASSPPVAARHRGVAGISATHDAH